MSRSSLSTSFARSFDAFSWKRLVDPQELTNASTLGAIISVCGGFLLLFLVVAETLSFLTPSLTSQVALDTSAENRPLRLTLNVTFPHLPCDMLSLEVTDALGTRNANLTSSNLHRITIDASTGRALMIRKDEGVNGKGLVQGSRTKRFFERLLGIDSAALARQRQVASGQAGDGVAAEQQFATRLDIDSFPQFIADNDLAVVAFGANWCPWSKRLAPIWEQVAEVVSSVPDVKLGKVDCASDGASQLLCLQHHIGAFPTILLFKGHHPHSHVHFHGERSVQGILDWLVAARQDEALTTDPKSPTTLEAHAAAERLARDVQLLEHPDGAEGGGSDHAAAGGASGHQHGAANVPMPSIDPAHPGAAQALIEAIHNKGLHAPGDAARALLKAIVDAGAKAKEKEKAGAAADDAPGSADAAARRLAQEQPPSAPAPPAPPRYGCQLAGYLDFRRVPTALSVYPNLEGRSADYSSLNMTHVVHDLFFGPKLSNYQLTRLSNAAASSSSSSSSSSLLSGSSSTGGIAASLHRLKGSQYVSRSWNQSHEHYLSVVGSRFTFLNGHEVESYGYSAASSAYEESGSWEALEALGTQRKLRAEQAQARVLAAAEQQRAAAEAEAARQQAEQAAAAAAAAAASTDAAAPPPAPAVQAAPASAPAPVVIADSPEAGADIDIVHVPHPMAKWSFAINPLSLHTREERQPFFKWLTSLCAIVGGVAVTLVLVDSVLHSLRGKASVKGRMNKLS